MRFNFNGMPSIYPDPNDEQYQLEKKIDRLHELPVRNQIALLYNDANNYVMDSFVPYDEWFMKRESMIREYATWNWVGLGLHLNSHRVALGNLCSSIHQKLQLLVKELDEHKRFQITVFCSVLGQIDYLWSTTLPSMYDPLPEDPTVIHLLDHFGQR